MRGRVGFELLLVWFMAAGWAFADSNGPPDGFAGNPPNMNTCIACHDTYPLNSGVGGVLPGGISTQYIPSHLYNLNVLVGYVGREHWGYQVTVLNAEGESAGIFLHADSLSVISDHPVPEQDFIGQSELGVLPGEEYARWYFDWYSAPEDTGPLTLYVVGVAADGDGTPANDYVYSYSAELQEIGGGISGPVAYADTTRHDYRLVPVNTTRSWTERLYSVGTDDLVINGWDWFNDQYFTVLEPAGPITLVPGEWTDVTIEFAPLLTGSWSDSLWFDFTGNVDLGAFAVEGRGTFPLPPEEFHLVSPEDGEHVAGDSLRFQWTPTTNPDSSNTTVDFAVEIDTESDFSSSTFYEAGPDTSLALPMVEFQLNDLYFWRVLARDTNTEGRYSDEEWVFIPSLSAVIETGPSARTDSPIRVNTWPNPSNDRAVVTFDLPRAMPVEVAVYTVSGRLVSVLHSGPMAAGRQTIVWTGTHPSGLYFLRLTAPGISPVHAKMLVLK
ncbi:T9SS type A sorting domain-containing protein [bacterium]|nr:T9SS type A sorting domain-containing protein [bacterium]